MQKCRAPDPWGKLSVIGHVLDSSGVFLLTEDGAAAEGSCVTRLPAICGKASEFVRRLMLLRLLIEGTNMCGEVG